MPDLFFGALTLHGRLQTKVILIFIDCERSAGDQNNFTENTHGLKKNNFQEEKSMKGHWNRQEKHCCECLSCLVCLSHWVCAFLIQLSQKILLRKTCESRVITRWLVRNFLSRPKEQEVSKALRFKRAKYSLRISKNRLVSFIFILLEFGIE